MMAYTQSTTHSQSETDGQTQTKVVRLLCVYTMVRLSQLRVMILFIKGLELGSGKYVLALTGLRM